MCEAKEECKCEAKEECTCEANAECMCEAKEECMCEAKAECMCETKAECMCEAKAESKCEARQNVYAKPGRMCSQMYAKEVGGKCLQFIQATNKQRIHQQVLSWKNFDN